MIMELDITSDQLWDLLCTIKEGDYPCGPGHIDVMFNKILPWNDSFNTPWIGLAFLRQDMKKDEYYFMLFSFLYEAKLAGDI